MEIHSQSTVKFLGTETSTLIKLQNGRKSLPVSPICGSESRALFLRDAKSTTSAAAISSLLASATSTGAGSIGRHEGPAVSGSFMARASSSEESLEMKEKELCELNYANPIDDSHDRVNSATLFK